MFDRHWSCRYCVVSLTIAKSREHRSNSSRPLCWLAVQSRVRWSCVCRTNLFVCLECWSSSTPFSAAGIRRRLNHLQLSTSKSESASRILDELSQLRVSWNTRINVIMEKLVLFTVPGTLHYSSRLVKLLLCLIAYTSLFSLMPIHTADATQLRVGATRRCVLGIRYWITDGL